MYHSIKFKYVTITLTKYIKTALVKLKKMREISKHLIYEEIYYIYTQEGNI